MEGSAMSNRVFSLLISRLFPSLRKGSLRRQVVRKAPLRRFTTICVWCIGLFLCKRQKPEDMRYAKLRYRSNARSTGYAIWLHLYLNISLFDWHTRCWYCMETINCVSKLTGEEEKHALKKIKMGGWRWKPTKECLDGWPLWFGVFLFQFSCKGA